MRINGGFWKKCRKRISIPVTLTKKTSFSQQVIIHPPPLQESLGETSSSFSSNLSPPPPPPPSPPPPYKSTTHFSSPFTGLPSNFTFGHAPSELSAKEINHLIRLRPFEDCLPFIAALIRQKQLKAAEQAFLALERYHGEEWSQWNDPGLANSILKAYLEIGNVEGGRKWQKKLLQPFSKDGTTMKADVLTFSILFDFYLKSDSVSERSREVRELYELMFFNFGITLDDVLNSRYLQASDIATLSSILKVTPQLSRPEDDLVVVNETFFIHSPKESTLKEENLNTKPIAEVNPLIPEATSITSQIDGIGFMKKALEALSNHSDKVNLYALQEQLERDCFQSASLRSLKEAEKFEEATGCTSRLNMTLRKLMAKWQLCLQTEIEQIIHNPSTLESIYPLLPLNSKSICVTLLSTLSPGVIAFITIQELCRVTAYDFSAGGIPVIRLARAIGHNLQSESFANQINEHRFLTLAKVNPQYLELKLKRGPGRFSRFMRNTFAELDRKEEALQQGWIPRWGRQLCMEVGALLAAVAVRCLTFSPKDYSPSEPAFIHRLVQSYDGPGSRFKTPGYVIPSPELWKLMSTDLHSLYWDPWAIPMVVPPRLWLTAYSGGYLTQRQPCIRAKDNWLQCSLITEADKKGQLEAILTGLDILGRTAWRINESILQVALTLWNQGVNVATWETGSWGSSSTAPLNKNIEQLPFRSVNEFSDRAAYIEYVKRSLEHRKHQTEIISSLCDTNYKLEIARRFVGFDFYLPHSVDFRGRAYPIPPHLSHIGSDLSRGLLIFAQGKELGTRGLKWLKIHLANMAGYDKASLEEREAFADLHREAILDSADNPLGGKQWWKAADEPWQCLAACMELAAVWRSADPIKFVSQLPCQQDGSCNGLQHYAALGGDYEGAKQVNLVPGPRPADVYGAVASLVAKRAATDAANDPTHIATKLVGKINRKIIKQPVMTNVYGVTPYGARQQIESRLKEFNVVEPADYKAARSYLATLVFESLGSLFDRAQQIQEWFYDTALEVSRSVPPSVAAKFGTKLKEEKEAGGLPVDEQTLDPADRYPQTSVMWTTPLGFPVLQPYARSQTVLLQTAIQSLTVQKSKKFDPINVGKQASAFPPNFIHSLDASHMFKTALACWEAGLTFASVHDCFWTHAGSVDEMGRVLREQFVALHQEPILDKLAQEMKQLYGTYLVPEGLKKRSGAPNDIRYMEVASWRPIRIKPLPPRGEFDINLVLQSDYFFS